MLARRSEAEEGIVDNGQWIMDNACPPGFYAETLAKA